MPNEEQQQMQLKITDEVSRGVYANAALINHTREEFTLDFVGAFPPSALVVARVHTSPGHLKRLIAALTENLKRYEAAFGTVQVGEAPETTLGFHSK